MKENQADAYVRALSVLSGTAFQDAIVQRLLRSLMSFEPVPPQPQGDGGTDGLSHKKTQAYCCYGPDLQTAKTPKQRSQAIVTKFSKDLRRLFELETNGKTLVHQDNSTLHAIFGAVPPESQRISRVSLIVNWFESNTILGDINTCVAACKQSSKFRWVSANVDVVIRGPRAFVDEYGVDEATMLALRHKDLFDQIASQAPSVDLLEGPSFDGKMKAAEGLLPGREVELGEVASQLRVYWRECIAHASSIEDRLPALHSALERARARLSLMVLMSSSTDPWDTIRRSQQIAEEVLTPDFAEQYGVSRVRDLASGEVARLVGICPINWKAPQPPNA